MVAMLMMTMAMLWLLLEKKRRITPAKAAKMVVVVVVVVVAMNCAWKELHHFILSFSPLMHHTDPLMVVLPVPALHSIETMESYLFVHHFFEWYRQQKDGLALEKLKVEDGKIFLSEDTK